MSRRIRPPIRYDPTDPATFNAVRPPTPPQSPPPSSSDEEEATFGSLDEPQAAPGGDDNPTSSSDSTTTSGSDESTDSGSDETASTNEGPVVMNVAQPVAVAPPPVIVVYHDPAYTSLDDPLLGSDVFTDFLQTICMITTNVRRYLFSMGVYSSDSVQECFRTHDQMKEFIEQTGKKVGKKVNVLNQGGNPPTMDVVVRFPLVQQIRLQASRLLIVCSASMGKNLDLSAVTVPELKLWSAFEESVTSSKQAKDISETGVPVLNLAGDAAGAYSLWKEAFTNFCGSYRSCYTGARLSYLLREDDDADDEDVAFYENNIDEYLAAGLSFDPAVNYGFTDENRCMANVMTKALGTNNKWANDLTPLLSKGHGRRAWKKLFTRVNGTAINLHSRVTILEGQLKRQFTGQGKGNNTIQAHNSAFNKVIIDLGNAGCVYDEDRQVREYLTSLSDPSLVSIKDAIRVDSTLRALEDIQERVVDVVEGRLADQMAQGNPRQREVKLAHTEGGNKLKKKFPKKKEKKGGHGRMKPADAAKMKLANPEGWFLTNKTLSPDMFHSLTSEEKNKLQLFRADSRKERAVKTLRSGARKVAPVAAITISTLSQDEEEEDDGKPEATLADVIPKKKKAKTTTTTTNDVVMDIDLDKLSIDNPVETPNENPKPVQFGRGAHSDKSVATKTTKKDE